jgi:hypothetical protein
MFKAIALGGGGVRGGLQVGALAAIEEMQGNLVFPDGIYGCSVGSIIATGVAFNMNAAQIKAMLDNDFHMSDVIPTIRLSTLSDFYKKKGAFSMDLLEEMIVSSFAKRGIEIRDKLISDSPQKLFIFAANMTTQKPTAFTGEVPLLSAIKASCCLPLVFHPQIIFNQVYLDGGVYIHCLADIVPSDCLVLHISTPPRPIFPADIETMSIGDMMTRVYTGMRKKPVHSGILWLQDETTGLMDTQTLEDKEKMYQSGYSQASRFLAKRFPEKLE